jgi:IclR family transcriptional regulator, pca regulon regulatory protein
MARAGAARKAAASGATAVPVVKTNDGDFVLSLFRGLSVLRAFSDGRTLLSVADAARMAGLSSSSARRCLHTLTLLGYTRHVPRHRAYELSPLIVDLRSSFLSADVMARTAGPMLQGVARQLGGSCSLARLDGDRVEYLRHEGTPPAAASRSTSTQPALETAAGRVLLAELDARSITTALNRWKPKRLTELTVLDKGIMKTRLTRVRRRGYEVVDRESGPDIWSVAVPVRRRGVVVAALSVDLPVVQESPHVPAVTTCVMVAAAQLGDLLDLQSQL